MASSLPAKGAADNGGGEPSSGDEDGALAAAATLGESPGPGSDSGSRSSPRLLLSLTEQFERAAQRVPALTTVAPKEQLLYLYARYKQDIIWLFYHHVSKDAYVDLQDILGITARVKFGAEGIQSSIIPRKNGIM
uniref:Uncharacterized protein n=1 Tax=Sphaerodactylus townsendi TaxID=933632 RepID=A0ACB8F2R1_9SAUR